jgi:CRP-like cAMP-binding protein
MKGDHPYDIFFIVRGRVNFLMDIGEVVFKAWPRGAYFGEIEIIFDKKRICSAKAPSGLDCDLFILNKKHYQTIIHRDFPEIDKQLRDIALERERRINLNIKTAMDVLKAIGVDEAEQDSSAFSPFQEQSA